MITEENKNKKIKKGVMNMEFVPCDLNIHDSAISFFFFKPHHHFSSRNPGLIDLIRKSSIMD